MKNQYNKFNRERNNIMSFFLAIITVAAIGVMLIGFYALGPIIMIITGFYYLYKSGGCEEDLVQEYKKYKKEREEELSKALNYTPYLYYVPTWFDQGKYAKRMLENQGKYEDEMIENNLLKDIAKSQTYTGNYKTKDLFNSAFYEIPFDPERICPCYKAGEAISYENIIYSAISDFGIRLAMLYEDDPNDETLKEYVQKVHNLDFGKWVYLEDPRYKEDSANFKYLTYEEFKTMTNPIAPEESKKNLKIGITFLIIGILTFVFLTIPLLSIK